MKNLISNWKTGLCYLFSDDLISFYTFFTIILAEFVYLRIFCVDPIIMPFTIILTGYVINVLVCALLKGYFEGCILEVIFTAIYSIVFVILFLIGCSINVKISLIVTIIPLIVTAILINIRVNNSTLLANFIVVGW